MWPLARDLPISTSSTRVKLPPLYHLPFTRSRSQHVSGASHCQLRLALMVRLGPYASEFQGVRDSTENKLPVSECNRCRQEFRVTRERTGGRHSHSDTNLALPHVVNVPIP